MGSSKCPIRGRRRRRHLAETRELLRLHSRPAYSYGYQRLAKTYEECIRVSRFPPSQLANSQICSSHLKPGGWFELQEIHHYPYSSDNSIPTNNLVAEYWALVIAGLSNLGVNFNATLLLENMMREAGFVNVSTTLFHVPIGMWPRNRVLKTVGQYWRTILMDGLQPIAMGPFTRGLGWSREQVDVYLVGVRKAYEMGGPHYWMPLHVICGQKPM